MLLSWRLWREYSVQICYYMLPCPCLWMLRIKRHSYEPRYMTQNGWGAIDADFQDGIGCTSLALFAMKVSNTLFMNIFDLLHPQITQDTRPTSHWYTLSGWGRAHVSTRFDHEAGQYIENGLWRCNGSISWPPVAHRNATMNVKPDTWNWSLEPSRLLKSVETCGWTGNGPGLSLDELAVQI